MKTMYRMLIGAAALAAGYAGYRYFRPRSEPWTAEVDEAVVETVEEEVTVTADDGFPAADAAEMVVGEEVVAAAVNDEFPTKPPETEYDLDAEMRKAFKDLVASFESGTVVTKENHQVALTIMPDGMQIMSLTRYHAKGNPIGHVYLQLGPDGMRYRTDGCFSRSRGTNLNRIVDLVLVFQSAIADK